MAEIFTKTNPGFDDFKIALNDWLYVSRIHPDNVRMQSDYSIVYGGLLEAIDVQLWTAWRKEFSFPTSWWDAFKIKVFPGWLLNRFPARIRKFSFAEVVPMLSKNHDTAMKQLQENELGHFESVVRKPVENFETFPLI